MNLDVHNKVSKQDKELKQSKAIKEVEMIAKDKNNKKILESFKEGLVKNKSVTA